MAGIYDPISRLKSLSYLPALSWDVCSYTERVADSFGLEIKPTKIQNSLSDYDGIIIPGGLGTRVLQHDNDFLHWIRTSEKTRYKISVCTGSLLLGAAGFLKGKRATTHYDAYDALRVYCREVLTDRIVEDGDVITAGAVSSSLDAGLYLWEKWAEKNAMEDVRRKMDYRN